MSSVQQPNDNNVESKAAEIKAALKKQVEFYFSPDNLARDTYLRNLMSDDQTVSISEICKFRKVSQLCSDSELLKKYLIESLDGSKICIITLDQLGIKPLPQLKPERNIIIIRDIPSSTDSNLLLEAFKIPEGKPVQSIRCDVGDNWFVTMANEADAMATMKFIHSQKIKFQNQPLKARLKSSAVSPRVAGGGGISQHSPRQQQHYNNQMHAQMHHRQPYNVNEYDRSYNGQAYYQQQRPPQVNVTYQQQGGGVVGGAGSYQIPPNVYPMPYNNINTNQYHSPRVNIPQLQMMPQGHMKNNQQSPSSNQYNNNNNHRNNNGYDGGNMTGRSPKQYQQHQFTTASPSSSSSSNDQVSNNEKKTKKNKNTKKDMGGNEDSSAPVIVGEKSAEVGEAVAVDLTTLEQQLNSDNGNIVSPSSSAPNINNQSCRGDELIKQLGGDMFNNTTSSATTTSSAVVSDTQEKDNSRQATNREIATQLPSPNNNNANNNNNNNANSPKKKGKDNKGSEKKGNKDNKKSQPKGKPAPTFTPMNFPPLGGKLGDVPPPNETTPSPLANPKITAAAIVAGRSATSSTSSPSSSASSPLATGATITTSPASTSSSSVLVPPVQSESVTSSPPIVPDPEPSSTNDTADTADEGDDSEEVAISFGTISFGDDGETADSPTNNKSPPPQAEKNDEVAVIEKGSKPAEQSTTTASQPVPKSEPVVPPEPVVWGKTSFSEVVKKKSQSK